MGDDKRKRGNQVARVRWWQWAWLGVMLVLPLLHRQLLSLVYGETDAYLGTYRPTPQGGRALISMGLCSGVFLYSAVAFGLWRRDFSLGMPIQHKFRTLRGFFTVWSLVITFLWAVGLLLASTGFPAQAYMANTRHIAGIRYAGGTYHTYLVDETIPGWGAVEDAEVFRCNLLSRGCERFQSTVTEVGPAGWFRSTYPRGIDKTGNNTNSQWLTCAGELPQCADVPGSGGFIVGDDGLHLCLRPRGMTCIAEHINKMEPWENG